MAAYLIVDIRIKEAQAYAEYTQGVTPLVHKHGGEYLARGGTFEVLEGDWRPGRLVLFRFPDRAAVHRFLDDPDYQPLKQLRHRVADTNAVVVDSV